MADDLPAPASPDNVPTLSPTSATSASSSLSRMAVERVLARAAELHNSSGLGDSSDEVSESQLLEIAREVGLSSASVRQAIAEERTRLAIDTPSEAGWLSRVTGPGVVSATRAVKGKPEDIMAALDTWMQREECLQVQRRFPDRIVWDTRSDWFNSLRRGLRLGGRSYQLSRALYVGATVIPIEDGKTLVRLDANISQKRTAQVRLGAIAGAGGVASAGTLITLGAAANAAALAIAFAAAIPVGLGVAGAYVALRQHNQLAGRVLLSLEQALDRLEFADLRKPATLLDVVAAMRPLVR